MGDVIQILLCEDQDLLCHGLKNTLGKEKDMRVGKSLSKAEDILPALKEASYDLLLSDIVTEEGQRVFDYLPEIRAAFPALKIVLITSFPDISFMERARSAGVNSFVYKNVPVKELLSLLRNTIQGYSIYPIGGKGNAGVLDALTPAEMRVLRLYCAGNDRNEIANALAISVSSVKNHISSILAKTGYPNLVKLGIYVVREGLVLPE